MQGKKKYNEKLFMSFQLSDRIPENNFYWRLKNVLDLNLIKTLRIQQANKVMLMAAMAYNLKKYLNFSKGKVKSMAEESILSFLPENHQLLLNLIFVIMEGNPLDSLVHRRGWSPLC